MVEIAAHSTVFDGEHAMLAIARDATARKEVEAQLVMNDRLASLGRLSASIGHELNNPLAYVLGNFRKHQPWDRAPVDPFSSAPHFEHFAELSGAPIHAAPHLVPRVLALDADNPPTARPGTWLLRTGWLRHGPLSLFEKPRSAR